MKKSQDRQDHWVMLYTVYTLKAKQISSFMIYLTWTLSCFLLMIIDHKSDLKVTLLFTYDHWSHVWSKDYPDHITLGLMIIDRMSLKAIRIMSPKDLWSWIVWPEGHPDHVTLGLMIIENMSELKTIRIMAPCYLWSWIRCLTWRPSGSCPHRWLCPSCGTSCCRTRGTRSVPTHQCRTAKRQRQEIRSLD